MAVQAVTLDHNMAGTCVRSLLSRGIIAGVELTIPMRGRASARQARAGGGVSRIAAGARRGPEKIRLVGRAAGASQSTNNLGVTNLRTRNPSIRSSVSHRHPFPTDHPSGLALRFARWQASVIERDHAGCLFPL